MLSDVYLTFLFDLNLGAHKMQFVPSKEQFQKIWMFVAEKNTDIQIPGFLIDQIEGFTYLEWKHRFNIYLKESGCDTLTTAIKFNGEMNIGIFDVAVNQLTDYYKFQTQKNNAGAELIAHLMNNCCR